MSVVQELSQVTRSWPQYLKKKKETGVKLVGYTGRFIPEELIYASGAVPFYMCRGGEPEPPEAVLPYLLRFMNPFSRAQVGYQLLGMDPVVPMLDLIVTQCDDCHMTRLADLLEYFKMPIIRVGVPTDWRKPMAAEYYYKRLARLKDKLEELTGNTISDERLRESIKLMNAIRERLRKISLLRKEQPPPIGGYDFIQLNHSSFYWEPEEVIQKLDDLYQELEQSESPFSKDAPRILLAGHVVASGDYAVPKLIEDSGAVIVTDFLDEGHRHFWQEVDTEGDLLKNIGEVYFLKRIPPSVFQPAWLERIDFTQQMIKDYQVDGVIWYQLSFDELYDLECSYVAKSMDEMGVSFLKLESSYEYTREAMGPLTTRIESFIASLKHRGVK